MTDLARALLDCEARTLASESPTGARAPTRRKSRREMPLHSRCCCPFKKTSNMMSLMVESKFLRVQQRPHQIAIDIFLGIAAFERLFHYFFLRVARQSSDGG